VKPGRERGSQRLVSVLVAFRLELVEGGERVGVRAEAELLLRLSEHSRQILGEREAGREEREEEERGGRTD
jgi:hypothetical protein